MTHPFIVNVSQNDIKTGLHEVGGPRAVLIQIQDTDREHVKPFNSFAEIHQFKFMDVNEVTADSITDEDAKRIADVLTKAFEEKRNVIVHCVAGVCRSGAVCQAGIEIGFNPPERDRKPNTLVMKKLRQQLGIEINAETSVFNWEDNL